MLGAGAAKKASRKAEQAQLGYLTQALGEERRQYDTTRADFAPYRDAGVGALGAEQDLLGLRGTAAQQGEIDALHDSPLYQSLYRTGLETNLQNASATGGIRGGNEARSLADFGSDTLARVIQQQLSNYQGLSAQGMGATAGTAQSGDNITQAIAQILGQQGQVRAGGLLTRGGITSGMWNNAGGFLDDSLKQILSGGMPGMGAGGF